MEELNKDARQKIMNEIAALDTAIERAQSARENMAPVENDGSLTSELADRKEKLQKDLDRLSGTGE